MEKKEEFTELFGPDNGMLFVEETMAPIFCKPRLIPLKTVTMEKLEQMQSDAIEKLKALEEKPIEEPEEAPDTTEKEERQPDIWTAE